MSTTWTHPIGLFLLSSPPPGYGKVLSSLISLGYLRSIHVHLSSEKAHLQARSPVRLKEKQPAVS
jgi:hypothetical protein